MCCSYYLNEYKEIVMSERLITIKEVTQIVGFKRSTIYKFIQQNKFPSPLKIGKSSRWKLTDIQKWINHQISKQE